MMRILLGVLLRDLPQYLSTLSSNSQLYMALHNRMEKLISCPDGNGYRCDWQWTSDLHAPKVLPLLGKWLMKRALTDHPIKFSLSPAINTDVPEISFIIGHRGLTRLPHLLATLESIAGQEKVTFECLVIEQDVESLLNNKLPAWVRHIHTPPPSSDMPYCRSWTFNIGVKEARGKVLILHDNDMLVPRNYAQEILVRVKNGYEVINLKRFIFYLSQTHTQLFFEKKGSIFKKAPETIVQNLEGGGSVAITRDAYDRIGGMDESFIGWGGEDNEFWERAQTCKVWPYSYLSLVHLWHPAQPKKYHNNNPTLQHYHFLSNISVEERIARLNTIDQGNMVSPCDYSHIEVKT